MQHSPEDREIVRPKVARVITGLSSSTIRRRGYDPDDDFPAPISLGEHAIGFYRDELIAWRDARPRLAEKNFAA